MYVLYIRRYHGINDLPKAMIRKPIMKVDITNSRILMNLRDCAYTATGRREKNGAKPWLRTILFKLSICKRVF